MSDEKLIEIEEELKTFPKPELQKTIQNQMLFELESFENKYQIRKKWGINMKKIFVGVMTAAAIISLSVLSYNTILGKDNSFDKSASQSGQNQVIEDVHQQPLDSVDLQLGEHQVAMEKLYFEIPMSRDKISIDRRVEGDYTLVDIRDKKTNELLYRYGENVGNKKVKIVFREVATEDGKIRINAVLDMNVNSNLINNIKDTSIEVLSSEFPFDNPFSDGLSRSGKFPSEKIEVIGRGSFWKKNEGEGYSEEFYEGFVVGVIPKD